MQDRPASFLSIIQDMTTLMNTFWRMERRLLECTLTQVWNRAALCPLCFSLCILMTSMRLHRVFKAPSQAQLVPLWRTCCMLMIWLTTLMRCRPCSTVYTGMLRESTLLSVFPKLRGFISICLVKSKSKSLRWKSPNSNGSNVPVFNVGRVPFAHKDYLKYLGWCFISTWAWLIPLSTQLVFLCHHKFGCPEGLWTRTTAVLLVQACCQVVQ